MDALKPFLQRIGQPIILSFCISWILWNWEIVIGLLWYDAKTIEKTGFKSHIELIKMNANGWKNYAMPLMFALLFLPLRFCINWLNALFRTKEKNEILNVTGTGKMSTLRFLELKKSYDDRLASISSYIDKEAEIQIEINNLSVRNTDLESGLKELDMKFKEVDNKHKSLQSVYDKVSKELQTMYSYSSYEFLIGEYSFSVYKRKTVNSMMIITDSKPYLQGSVSISHSEDKDTLLDVIFTYMNTQYAIGVKKYFCNTDTNQLLIVFSEIYYSNELVDENMREILLDLQIAYHVIDDINAPVYKFTLRNNVLELKLRSHTN